MSRLITSLILSCFALLITLPSWAQFAQRGGIAGTVFDPSGAVVPAAQITLLDLAQNQTRVLTADNLGHFEFDNIAAGQYRLTASAPGFAVGQSAPITVNIGVIAHYDFKLHAGSINETVTVTGDVEGLETEQASVATNISERQFEELPLNGRNFTSIAALAPGVATYPQANLNPLSNSGLGTMFETGGVAFTAGGAFQGFRDSGYYLNGVNINDNWTSSNGFLPSAEALGTGTLQVGEFSAAIGNDIASLSMQTKAGTSKYHGELFEFLENDALNAFDPWSNALQIITQSPSAKPVLRRNQFGGNVGGPIPIPGIKNKLFFFVNYEKFIEHDGSQLVTGSVPSAAERGGDFSELLGDNPNPTQLYNPFFTTYDESGNSSRPAIPNNRLDLATRPDGSPLIDPASANIITALWPLPNVPNVPSNEVNYVAYQSPRISTYHLDTRFDANLTSNDRVFVTWSHTNGQSSISGGMTPTELHNFPLQSHSYLVTANYVHVFTPHLTNEFILGIGDVVTLFMLPSQHDWYNSDDNPLNSLFANTGTSVNRGVMGVYAGNYSSVGTTEIDQVESLTRQFSDNLDWVVGRHTLSMGMNFFRKGEHDWDIQRNMYFGGVSASGSDLGYIGGDGIADLEMGIPNNMWVRNRFNSPDPYAPGYHLFFPNWGFYVNDRFHATPKLTVSAGLRYELDIPAYSPDPNTAPCCAIYTPTTDGGILKYPGIAVGVPQHYLHAHKLNFAPRLSIAYSLTPKTVIRAGYGLFYDTGASQISLRAADSFFGASSQVNYNVNNSTLGYPADTPVLTLADVFPVPTTIDVGSFTVPTGKGEGYEGDGTWSSVTYYDQKSTTVPYLQRTLLDVQRQIGTHDMITLSYSGAQGRKGINEANTNLPPYQTGWVPGSGSVTLFDAARPNNIGRFSDIFLVRPNLNSFYNALIVQYKHEFSRGFQILSNYTWGKTVSDYPTSNPLAQNATPGSTDIAGFQYSNLYSRGESNQSHRHRFVFSGIWSPQYGKQWPQWAKLPLTGWRLTGIVTMESGDALTVTNGGPSAPCPADASPSVCPTGYGSSAQDNAGFDELMVSGNPNISHGDKTFSRQFNTSVFSVPPMNVRGNSGLGTVRGPGQNNLDLSIAKTFPIRESMRFELRADAFNAFNHTQWTGVNTTFPSGDALFPFGQVNGAREARIVQIAAKLLF